MSNRYARHHLIAGWNQENLQKATVIVVGMGALGNEVARILVMAGVGHLLLCDPDRLEESNLSRTLLFRQSDLGQLKVEAAARALVALNPELRVEVRSQPLVQGVGLAELRDANLVLSCLDSRSARLQLAGRCKLVRVPYLDGGTHPWGGEVRPYLEPEGPCYGCSLSAEERGVADVPWSCLDTREENPLGAAIPSSALVGTWMGTISVRFLMGLSCPAGFLKIDGARGTTVVIEQKRAADCPLHFCIDSATRIGVGSQDTMLKLRSTLPKLAVPLAWEPVQQGVECASCGFGATRWGLPALEICPQCQKPLRPRTTVELDKVPDEITLSTLGIPPREILAVRTQEGLKWFELES